ncbi:MAG: hypothetical protein K1X72_20255 [Pyrinomonadaceae bacterium]|nr:hypothetical protein [Pyrinomonadaceae bacterium]
MKNSKTIFALAISFIFALTIFAMPVDQPFMKAAKTNLNQAKSNLNKATVDKGGHRNKALGLVKDAINEVEQGIKFDRRNGTEDFDANDIFNGSETNSMDQPYMQKAKDNLQEALDNLNKATADKGGHRNKAIDLVKEAIEQVNKGIAFDRKN